MGPAKHVQRSPETPVWTRRLAIGRGWLRYGLGSAFLILFSLGPGALSATEPSEDGRQENGRESVQEPGSESLSVPGEESLIPTPIPRATRTRGPAGKERPGLDALLQLPSSFRARETPSVAGADEAEWRRRFVAAERKLASAQEDLARTKRELDEVAESGGSSQWSVAPPGASGGNSPSTSPLSFKHREAMRRTREELESAERALRELKIEADLAGVPLAWRSAAAPGSIRGMSN